jgi:F-type H+-transporting ATPase subunit delta
VPGAAARRYARAIFELAQEEGQVEDWAARLAHVRDVFAIPEVGRVLQNPTITVERRQEAVTAVLAGQGGPEAVNLARLLVESDRLDQVGDIAEDYSDLADEAAGRVRVTATTAVDLTEREKERLASDLSARLGKEVRLTARVDPRILGGLVVQTGDRIIDASLASRLHQLRRRLAGV